VQEVLVDGRELVTQCVIQVLKDNRITFHNVGHFTQMEGQQNIPSSPDICKVL
jgi:hypothetical protein